MHAALRRRYDDVPNDLLHCIADTKKLDLEWKITYVGSAENETHDQVLEEILVGPIPVGTNKFVFQVSSSTVFFCHELTKENITG